jgi:hypothetical protein
MGSNTALVRAFSNLDFGKLISANFKPNRRTGAVTAKAVGNGTVNVLIVTKTGVKIFKRYIMPTAESVISKRSIAIDLHKNGVKGTDIADLLQVSASTVSRWLKK